MTHGSPDEWPPIKDLASPSQKRPRHVHRYATPVEWEYIFGEMLTGGVRPYIGLKTTILRCDCGKEIRREGEA